MRSDREQGECEAIAMARAFRSPGDFSRFSRKTGLTDTSGAGSIPGCTGIGIGGAYFVVAIHIG
jgi:hypothetical protein